MDPLSKSGRRSRGPPSRGAGGGGCHLLGWAKPSPRFFWNFPADKVCRRLRLSSPRTGKFQKKEAFVQLSRAPPNPEKNGMAARSRLSPKGEGYHKSRLDAWAILMVTTLHKIILQFYKSSSFGNPLTMLMVPSRECPYYFMCIRWITYLLNSFLLKSRLLNGWMFPCGLTVYNYMKSDKVFHGNSLII